MAAQLRIMGLSVRTASRSASPRFDWHDRSTWRDAVHGVRTLYLATPEEEVPVQEFVAHAVQGGVERIVALSGRGLDNVAPPDRGPDDSAPEFVGGMLQVEQAVRHPGAEWSIMRPNNFNQNFDEYVFREEIRSGELVLPMAGTPEPFIDAEDIAAVATTLLTEDGHHGQIYEMSGPRALEFGTAVEIIARASNREVHYRDISPEDYIQLLLDRGTKRDAAESQAALFSIMRRGVMQTTTASVGDILGREPIDFTSYALRAAAAGAWD